MQWVTCCETQCVVGRQVRLLDEEVLEAAVTVQKLQRRRANLKALHHKLQVHIALHLVCV